MHVAALLLTSVLLAYHVRYEARGFGNETVFDFPLFQTHPFWHNHIRVQQENVQLQPGLETELGGGAGQGVETGPGLSLGHVSPPSQWCGVGHQQVLETGGSQEQMRLGS